MLKKWLILFTLINSAINSGIDLIIPCGTYSKSNNRSVDMTVSTHLGAGFFAEFTKVLASIIHYEQEGLAQVFVDWTHEFFPYKDSRHGNGWDLYFEPVIVEQQGYLGKPQPVMGGSFHELHDQICTSPWLLYNEFLPYRKFVNQKINQYIHIKKVIIDQVDEFYKKNLQNYLCVGVHIRFAAAHAHEVPGGKHPSLDDYCSEINSIMEKNAGKVVKIYLATDSNYVIEYFKNKYNTNLIYIDAYRASGAEDPGLIYENSSYWLSHPEEWHKRKPGFYGGLTTLLDCLLLARCMYLIHTTSNVSNFVTFFNPDIRSIYLPRNAVYVSCRYKDDLTIKNTFLNPI